MNNNNNVNRCCREKYLKSKNNIQYLTLFSEARTRFDYNRP